MGQRSADIDATVVDEMATVRSRNLSNWAMTARDPCPRLVAATLRCVLCASVVNIPLFPPLPGLVPPKERSPQASGKGEVKKIGEVV